MSVTEDAVAGAIGGIVSRTISAPFDVLKIRFQLQFGQKAKYSSVGSAFREIVREEGVLSLWKGNLSASYLWVTYMGVQFGIYGGLKRLFADGSASSSSSKSSKKSLASFFCGATAATVACGITYPFDIMRTQFVMQGKDRVVPTMKQFVLSTVSSRGVQGLYAGLAPALVGITPYMGLNFALFEAFKDLTRSKRLTDSDSVLLSALRKGAAGGAAGGLSKLIVYPLDTVKKRLQIQVLQNTVDPLYTMPRYSGIWNCLSSTFHAEGLRGLYKVSVMTRCICQSWKR
jgi:solute carrier family 25 thiamine pyrophosphate transporter 19